MFIIISDAFKCLSNRLLQLQRIIGRMYFKIFDGRHYNRYRVFTLLLPFSTLCFRISLRGHPAQRRHGGGHCENL